jgi:hypothetical protein
MVRVRDEQIALLDHLTLKASKFRVVNLLPQVQIFSDNQASGYLPAPIEGITKYGPYDVNTTDSIISRRFNGIEIFVFYPRNQSAVLKGLESLMYMLQSGYFSKRGRTDTIFNGFEHEFRLREVFVPEPSAFIPFKQGKLHEAIRRAELDYSQVIQRGNRPVAIVGGTSHRSVRENREMYIEAKRELTSLDIPCQYASFYEHETGGAGILYQVVKGMPLGYALWNFALNLYGKVGGLPWIIRQRLNDKGDKSIDLTIGLRFVRDLTQKGYVIGHATILDRFGKFVGVVSSQSFKASFERRARSMVVPKAIMQDLISEALEKAISDERVRPIFETRDELNIAIHRTSVFHREEILGIETALELLREFGKVKYGLVCITAEPSLVLFDSLAKFMNVTRGVGLALNDNTALIYTAGPVSLTSEAPISYPVIVTAQNLNELECPFASIDEVCNHVNSLVSLHWQTVVGGSVRLPASLEFAKYIGSMSRYGAVPKRGSWLWKTLWFI